jgi:hypothetical protein
MSTNNSSAAFRKHDFVSLYKFSLQTTILLLCDHEVCGACRILKIRKLTYVWVDHKQVSELEASVQLPT